MCSGFRGAAGWVGSSALSSGVLPSPLAGRQARPYTYAPMPHSQTSVAQRPSNPMPLTHARTCTAALPPPHSAPVPRPSPVWPVPMRAWPPRRARTPQAACRATATPRHRHRHATPRHAPRRPPTWALVEEEGVQGAPRLLQPRHVVAPVLERWRLAPAALLPLGIGIRPAHEGPLASAAGRPVVEHAVSKQLVVGSGGRGRGRATASHGGNRRQVTGCAACCWTASGRVVLQRQGGGGDGSGAHVRCSTGSGGSSHPRARSSPGPAQPSLDRQAIVLQAPARPPASLHGLAGPTSPTHPPPSIRRAPQGGLTTTTCGTAGGVTAPQSPSCSSTRSHTPARLACRSARLRAPCMGWLSSCLLFFFGGGPGRQKRRQGKCCTTFGSTPPPPTHTSSSRSLAHPVSLTTQPFSYRTLVASDAHQSDDARHVHLASRSLDLQPLTQDRHVPNT